MLSGSTWCAPAATSVCARTSGAARGEGGSMGRGRGRGSSSGRGAVRPQGVTASWSSQQQLTQPLLLPPQRYWGCITAEDARKATAAAASAPVATEQPAGMQRRLLEADAQSDFGKPWGACGGLNGPTAKDEASVACPDRYACIRQDECARGEGFAGAAAAAAQQHATVGQRRATLCPMLPASLPAPAPQVLLAVQGLQDAVPRRRAPARRHRCALGAVRRRERPPRRL
jgi:hypothetical protein